MLPAPSVLGRAAGGGGGAVWTPGQGSLRCLWLGVQNFWVSVYKDLALTWRCLVKLFFHVALSHAFCSFSSLSLALWRHWPGGSWSGVGGHVAPLAV